MDPLLKAFIAESRQNIEVAGHCFLALEDQPDDQSMLENLFRAVHTIKGSAGLFALPEFLEVVHAAEDVLEVVRRGALRLAPADVDLFLEVLDQVGIWLDDLESTGRLGENAAVQGKILHKNLRKLLGAAALEVKPQAADDPTPDIMRADRKWLRQIPDADWSALSEGIPINKALLAFTYTPASKSFFSGTDPLHTCRQIPGLRWLHVSAAEPWPEPGSLDAFDCRLIFRGLVWAQKAELSEHFRYMSEFVTIATVISKTDEENKCTNVLGNDQDDGVCDNNAGWAEELMQPALDLLHTQRDLLDLSNQSNGEDGALSSILSVVRNTAHMLELVLPACFQNSGVFSKLVQPEITEAAWPEIHDTAVAAINALIAQIKHARPKAKTVADVEKTDLRDSNAQMSLDVSLNDGQSQPQLPSAKNETGTGQAFLRVDQERVDHLMGLIGELVVAKNGLPFLAKRAEEEFHVRALSKEIKAQHGVINRLATEMQSAMMQMRLTPVSTMFQRFPRLVRDLSRKLDKKITLTLEGEDTEADKGVIESLSDPLIHLIRNCLDHGLERPEERVAAGKSAHGNITLRAVPQDDQVTIEVIDDGRGIDLALVKKKAYEKGIIDEVRLESIKDSEAMQLIFAAGFSTVGAVSELSGRGVGMDVVRTAVEKAGGQVSVFSEKGRGTKFQLALPLSMAVSRVMMISVAGQQYGIAMDSILETVRVAASDVKRIKHREAMVLRDQLIPVVHLRRLLGLEMAAHTPAELSILVLSYDGEQVGLVIDEFHEGLDIIQKPLAGIMANFPCYSGSALLGNGNVLLILNCRALLSCQ